MKVGIFVTPNNLEHNAALHAFAAGVRTCGHDTVIAMVNDYHECDVAVVFGVHKLAVPDSFYRGHIIELHREQGKPVIVLEKGFVNRDDYYSAGFTHLNGRADFRNKDCPGDRWDALGVDLEPWRGARPGHVLLVGQVPHDAAVQHIDFNAWTSSMAHHLTQMGFPVVHRPHPLAQGITPELLGVRRSTDTLENDLENASHVVTFNSNVGVDAVIRGIPTLSWDCGSMVWSMTGHNLDYMTRYEEPLGRQQWANNLAYTQWTLDEMRMGDTWSHLMGEHE